MDDIDALLEDLQKSSITPARQPPPTVKSTRNALPTTHTNKSKQVGRSTTSLQSNVNEISQMLAELDDDHQFDVGGGAGDDATGNIPEDYAATSEFHAQLEQQRSTLRGNSIFLSASATGGHAIPSSTTASVSNLDSTVAQCSQDLDTLMNSLHQMKQQQQQQQNNSVNSVSQSKSNRPSSNHNNPPVKQQDNLDRMMHDLANQIKSASSTVAGATTTTAAPNQNAAQQEVQAEEEICPKCDKPISGKMVTAMGRAWHWDHFVCGGCGCSLASQTFFEREAEAFCEPCHTRRFCPPCAYCGEPISDVFLNALELTWHPEHFFCTNCQRSFAEGEDIHEQNSRPYCVDCYFDLFGSRCARCEMPITNTYVTAMDKQFHDECFTCSECNESLDRVGFFELHSQLFCQLHYHKQLGSICQACNQPITGRCINALGQRFHPEHFVCELCMTQLTSGTFNSRDSKPYCHACYSKLF